MKFLKVLRPPPKSTTTTFYDHSDDPWFKNLLDTETSSSSSCVTVIKQVPVYLKGQGFRPIEFGDGGAFPEIHVSQYPLGLGKFISSTTLPMGPTGGGSSTSTDHYGASGGPRSVSNLVALL